MSTESDQTEVHTADNLKPAAAAESSDSKKKTAGRGYSVNVEGEVYSVTAGSAEEAGEKAKQLHKKNKGSKS